MPSLSRTTSGVDSMSISRTFSHSVTFSQKSERSDDIDGEQIGKHRRKVVFLMLACSNVINNMCLALISPIFPQVVSILF